jgi:hypothetical protein
MGIHLLRLCWRRTLCCPAASVNRVIGIRGNFAAAFEHLKKFECYFGVWARQLSIPGNF